jgi:hypothetical protein
MNVEIGAEAALFPEKEYINGIAVAVRCVITSLVASLMVAKLVVFNNFFSRDLVNRSIQFFGYFTYRVLKLLTKNQISKSKIVVTSNCLRKG